MCVDAVPAEFISGVAEWISPENKPTQWDIVEGQGSLFPLSFAGVTLGLLHGSQPDAFVVCHEPTRTKMRGVEHPIPSIEAVIDLTVRNGQLTNPDIRPVGIAINTAALTEEDARQCLDETAARHGLPACDPMRGGVGAIVDHLADLFNLS